MLHCAVRDRGGEGGGPPFPSFHLEEPASHVSPLSLSARCAKFGAHPALEQRLRKRPSNMTPSSPATPQRHWRALGGIGYHCVSWSDRQVPSQLSRPPWSCHLNLDTVRVRSKLVHYLGQLSCAAAGSCQQRDDDDDDFHSNDNEWVDGTEYPIVRRTARIRAPAYFDVIQSGTKPGCIRQVLERNEGASVRITT